MSQEPQPVADANAARPAAAAWAAVRAEDWLLAGWVAIAAPLLARVEPSTGPFDAGQPLQGVLRLGAVLAALACAAARVPAGERSANRSILGSGAVGPFAGGLLLVAVSGGTALGLSSSAVVPYAALALVVIAAVRMRVPTVPAPVRRALVTPFVLAAGALFWTVIDAVVGAGLGRAADPLSGATPSVWLPAAGFFVAFSAVYYAMLVYAPRQVAEPGGGPVTWLLRYAMFAGGTLLGVAWVAALAG